MVSRLLFILATTPIRGQSQFSKFFPTLSEVTLKGASAMKIGFTGTRKGMTEPQKASLKAVLREFQRESLAFECHHGDCVGADDEFADLCAEVYRCLAHIVCHPPLDESHRAFNVRHNEIRQPKNHFARNRDIVNACDVMVVCPWDMEHQPRGGTWYTFDVAMKQKKPVFVVWPDGSVQRPE